MPVAVICWAGWNRGGAGDLRHPVPHVHYNNIYNMRRGGHLLACSCALFLLVCWRGWFCPLFGVGHLWGGLVIRWPLVCDLFLWRLVGGHPWAGLEQEQGRAVIRWPVPTWAGWPLVIRGAKVLEHGRPRAHGGGGIYPAHPATGRGGSRAVWRRSRSCLWVFGIC